MKREVIVIAHNIRSTHNVGAIFRTCDGFGVGKLYLTGYTPYPAAPHDTRLAHERDKITRQIRKTALGAEAAVAFAHADAPEPTIRLYQQRGYTIVALEQTPTALSLPAFYPPARMVLLLGEEVNGLSPALLRLAGATVEIPMVGRKESFNVSVAAGIALYALSYSNHKITTNNP